MPTGDINLTDDFEQSVEGQIHTGSSKKIGDVFQAGLPLPENQAMSEEEKLACLRNLADAGFRSLDQERALGIESEETLLEVISQIGLRASKSGNEQRKHSGI